MASALFSSRRSSCCAASRRKRQQKQNYHILFDFRANFRRAHEIFLPASAESPRGSPRPDSVLFKMQFRDLPELQAEGQFVAQKSGACSRAARACFCRLLRRRAGDTLTAACRESGLT